MTKDIRNTKYWESAQEHFDSALRPGLGQVTSAVQPNVSRQDGRVAFTGTIFTELAGLPGTRICIADSIGGAVQVVSEGASDHCPQWSPDGGTLAFLTDTAVPGVHQLVLRTDAGCSSTPQVDGSVEWIRWAPDGNRILLGVADLGADLAGAQGSSTLSSGEDALPAWFPEVLEAEQGSGWRRLWIYDIAGDSMQVVSREGMNAWEAGWMGEEIAVIATDQPGEEAWYQAELLLLDPRTGTERPLLSSKIQLGVLAGAPAGGRLAVVEAVCSDRGIVAGDLLVVDTNGSTVTVPTDGVDVTWAQWSDDRTLAWMGIRGMTTVAGVWSLDEGHRQVWESSIESCGLYYPEASVTPDGGLVIVRESYHLYPEIAKIEISGNIQTITSFEHAGAEYIRGVGGSTKPYRWTAPDGLEIEGLLTLPEGDGPFPLVVFIHGGPVWAYRPMWSMLFDYTPYFASKGWAVLHPNPRGSSGRGKDFARAVVGDMGGADTHDFISGVESTIADGVVDPDRVVVTGASYGGYMSAWLPTQTDIFAASIPIAEVSDWSSQHWTSNIPHFDTVCLDASPFDRDGKYWDRSPLVHAARVQTPMLHITGALDRCTPASQAVAFHKALCEVGAVSECLIYPQEGHGVRAFPAVIDHLARMSEFLDRHIVGGFR